MMSALFALIKLEKEEENVMSSSPNIWVFEVWPEGAFKKGNLWAA